MEKLDQHDPRIADMLRKAAQDTRQQEKRIAVIFGTQEIPKVNAETLAIYLDYLKQHLDMPCHLTGAEDRGCFAWEERYRFLPERADEYAERRKQEPSYKDTYELLNFEDEYGEIGKHFIHVHHRVDISHTKGEHVIDPTEDLVPLCPNCHAMVHTEEPAMSVEKLKEIFEARHT